MSLRNIYTQIYIRYEEFVGNVQNVCHFGSENKYKYRQVVTGLNDQSKSPLQMMTKCLPWWLIIVPTAIQTKREATLMNDTTCQ